VARIHLRDRPLLGCLISAFINTYLSGERVWRFSYERRGERPREEWSAPESGLSSGANLYRLQAVDFFETKRMVVVR
jgi:hypothetical protein